MQSILSVIFVKIELMKGTYNTLGAVYSYNMYRVFQK